MSENTVLLIEELSLFLIFVMQETSMLTVLTIYVLLRNLYQSVVFVVEVFSCYALIPSPLSSPVSKCFNESHMILFFMY